MFRKILVPLDGSTLSEAVILHLAKANQRNERGGYPP